MVAALGEAGNALGPHRVGDAGNQGRLRPDDHEIRADLVGQGTDSLGVARITGLFVPTAAVPGLPAT